MPQCHKSIFSCSLIRLNTTLTNEGTFVCDVIEAQWMHWSDLYIDKLCLIYFTKDWTKFYLKNLFTLARILNDVELLPSVYKVLNFASICRIARCITFCVKRVLNSLIFRLYRECVKCCVCLVVLCWCFTALRHFSGHFGRGQLTYPHCTWASLLGSLPVLSAHSFASNWQLPILNLFFSQVGYFACYIAAPENVTLA